MDLGVSPWVIAALQLIIVHRTDGAQLAVNPAQITALHPPTAENKLLVRPAQCAIWLSSGKLLAVVETCDQIKAMLEAAPP